MIALKKELVALLEAADKTPSKVDLALIKVEGVVRRENEIQAIEVLQIMCELLHERTGFVASSKRDEPPPDLVPAMHTLIWAAPRLGLDDLTTLKKQLSLKFGADFVSLAAKNQSAESRVERKVAQRLTPPVPTLEHKVLYLRSIVEKADKDIDVARLVGLSSAGPIPDTDGLEDARPGGGAGEGGGEGGGAAAAAASSSYPPAGFPAPPSGGGFSPAAGYPAAGPSGATYPAAAYPGAAYPPAGPPAYPAAAPAPAPSMSYPPAPPPSSSAAYPTPAAYPGPAEGLTTGPPASGPGLSLTADDLEARFAKLRGPGP